MSERYQIIHLKFNTPEKTQQFLESLNNAFINFSDWSYNFDEDIVTDKVMTGFFDDIAEEPLGLYLNKDDIIHRPETIFLEYFAEIQNDELMLSFMNGEWFWERMLPMILGEGITYVFSTVDIAIDAIEVTALVDGKLVPIYEMYYELGYDDEIIKSERRHRFLKELFDSGKIGLTTANIIREKLELYT